MAFSLIIDDRLQEYKMLVQAAKDAGIKENLQYMQNFHELKQHLIMGLPAPEFIFTSYDMPFLKAHSYLIAMKEMPALANTKYVIYSETIPRSIQMIPMLGAHHFYCKPTRRRHHQDILTRILYKKGTPFFVMPYQYS
ncbi:hypothetical protein LVD15_19865 [Fulvivirga maritima]|uniref:hypothetical protein n=1 Tax=Fulvivirga maritima TaxID=2904247 RepID=UPI001F217C02|nr:hypothetical protein [Fulvivirga maritima]UII25544.1 hypothetical protein LVD15_19865 [Fulvivirga maritima]